MVICLEQGLTFFRIYSGFLKWSSFLQSSYLPSQVFWRHWNFISGASGIKHLWTHDSTHLSNSQEKNQKILSLVLQINECVIIHQLYSRKVKTLGDSLCLGIYLIDLKRFNILISSVFVRSIPFLSFIVLIFAWKFPLVSLSFCMRFLVVLILLFSSISLHWYLGRLSYLSLLFFETLHSNRYVFPFSFAFCFSSFHSYLSSLLRQPFCLFVFLFLGDGLDHCLLYNVCRSRSNS